MADTVFNGVIRLRKDTEINYQKIENGFIPADGEVCIYDTTNGIRIKIGNGSSLLKDLSFIDVNLINQINSIVTRGYYLNGKFYTDSTYITELPHELTKVYIDANSNVIYQFNGQKYISVNDTLPTASDIQAGVMKLYKTKGQNEDGTMSQKAISDNLNTKFEVIVDEESETAIFTISL